MATAIAPRQTNQAPAALASAPIVTPITWITYPTMAAVGSSDPAHAPYIVSKLGNGSWACDTTEDGRVVACKGFSFRGGCRHLSAVLAPLPATHAPKPARMCEFCGVDVARQASCFCSDRCADRAYTAEAAGELAAMDTEVAPSTDAEIAETARVSQEIRREMAGLPAPDTFLGRLMATPTAAERNQAALAAHGMSLAGGTRIERSTPDPLAF